jgi:hypothetical protein
VVSVKAGRSRCQLHEAIERKKEREQAAFSNTTATIQKEQMTRRRFRLAH